MPVGVAVLAARGMTDPGSSRSACRYAGGVRGRRSRVGGENPTPPWQETIEPFDRQYEPPNRRLQPANLWWVSFRLELSPGDWD
jgi:hypothetical protein